MLDTMDVAALRHLDELRALSPAALEVVARQARTLSLPAGRWLVRPGRALPDRYYLLRGRVRLLQEGRRLAVAARSPRARMAVYPGVAGVETLTAATFLGLAPALLDTLRRLDERGAAALAVPQVAAAEDCWQRRFLTSPLMQRLDPGAWQRVLRAMSRHEFAAGEDVIRAGEPGVCCYVLCSGAADILAPEGSRRLATLLPGQLFGEDALLSGGGRNATVRLRAPGSAVSLPASRFEAWLVQTLTPPLARAGDRLLLRIGGQGPGLPLQLSALRAAAATLPAGKGYAVTGGSARQRRLAAFLLAEQGVDARPLTV